MPSLQSSIFEFWIRRQNFFGDGKIDPQSLRKRMERSAGLLKPHGKVRIVPVEADTVPAEWLIPQGAPKDQALLYIHGGAWFMGSTKTHRALVSHLAHASGIRALLINYRLAPEYPFPAGLEDCITAYEWLLKNGLSAQKIVVAGDSAGGNLSLALLIALRDASKPLPACAVALSPATDLALSGESYKTQLHLDPFFSNFHSTSIIEDYITNHDPHHPLISPLYADLSGLPPLLIHVGEHEILLDDAVRFGISALAAGVEAQTVVWPGMFHVFHMFAPILPEAIRADEQIAAFILSRLNGGLSSDERNARITKLMWSLQAVAQPADVQLLLFPDFVFQTDEVMLDFDDALLLIKGELWSTLTPSQVEALIRIDDKMTEMTREFDPNRIPEDALRSDPQWEELRALAKQALMAFNWPDLPPPSDPLERGITFVRSR
jgi:acetyl esterase/lipase